MKTLSALASNVFGPAKIVEVKVTMRKEESATLRIAECSFDLRNEADVTQKPGRDRHNLVEVLHLEAISVLCN